MVPSNYFPLRPDGSDKRYWKKTSEFFAAAQSEKIIYDGDWDGTFKESWSDNPAWILFDLLTNKRYGLGNFVSASQVNVWELYKIGRFCDAVNDSGYFEGVTDANGGLEPRYSCNVVIADKTNVFDVIKSITSTFRGNIFYLNSYIDFTDDRVKLPKYFFNNQNVRDGIFNYTNSRRDEQFNAIDVSYFDRNDGFKVKTEYIEDPEDIKKRGVLRTEIDTFGITSRAQANRIGKHIIYSTINENQAVSFSCGPEILSCRPGDLISVEDDLKTLEKNIGRVLDIDYTNKVLRLDEKIDAQKFLNEVTLFVPTGMRTYQDYYDKAVSPSKLAMSQLYANDVPQVATFYTTGYTNLDYGCNLYLDPTGQNISLLEKAVAGGIYSITLSGLKQEIYKVLSIREDSNLEYSVAAAKFDTGKFGQIESGQSLVDFYNSYPNVQSPTQGESSIQQNNVYQLSFPVIQQFNTGNYDLQNDSVDFSGSWSSVPGATHYDYELVTPKFRSITGRTTGLSATFTDQTEAGRFTFRVSARNENSIPNPISPICSSGITVLSFSAPIRSNSVFAGISVKNS
jgi:predicted phage tail protein